MERVRKCNEHELNILMEIGNEGDAGNVAAWLHLGSVYHFVTVRRHPSLAIRVRVPYYLERETFVSAVQYDLFVN